MSFLTLPRKHQVGHLWLWYHHGTIESVRNLSLCFLWTPGNTSYDTTSVSTVKVNLLQEGPMRFINQVCLPTFPHHVMLLVQLPCVSGEQMPQRQLLWKAPCLPLSLAYGRYSAEDWDGDVSGQDRKEDVQRHTRFHCAWTVDASEARFCLVTFNIYGYIHFSEQPRKEKTETPGKPTNAKVCDSIY